MRIDFSYLGKELTDAGLSGKPIDQYTQEEVMALCVFCTNALMPDIGAKFSEPFITPAGELVIPADSDPRFHWWKKCGQSAAETLRELRVSDEVWRKYTNTPNEKQ